MYAQYVCMYDCMYDCTCMYVQYVCTVCMYVRTVCMYVCMYVLQQVQAFQYVYTTHVVIFCQICMHGYICMYVCMYVCIH